MKYLNFELKDLPSRGLLYPESIEGIALKPYTGNDIEELNNEDRDMLSLIKEFKKGVEGIEADKVLYMDFLYMMLYRTASLSNNSALSLNLTCPFCNTEFLGKIDYTQVELYDFDNYLDLFPLAINLKGQEVLFTLPTIAHIEELITIQEGKAEFELLKTLQQIPEKDLSQDDRLTIKNLEKRVLSYQAAGSLILMEQKSKLLTLGLLANMDTLTVINLLKEESSPEILETLDFIDELSSSAFKSYVLPCAHCAKDIKISLEGLAMLLRPFRASTHTIADRIRATKNTKTKQL